MRLFLSSYQKLVKELPDLEIMFKRIHVQYICVKSWRYFFILGMQVRNSEPRSSLIDKIRNKTTIMIKKCQNGSSLWSQFRTHHRQAELEIIIRRTEYGTIKNNGKLKGGPLNFL